MNRTLITFTIAAIAAFSAPGVANANEASPVCAGGYVAAGPYCVNPIYVNNPLFVDPATCVGGYYQGSCVVPAVVDTPELSAAVGPASPVAVSGCVPTSKGTGCSKAADVVERVPVGLTSDALRLALTRGPR